MSLVIQLPITTEHFLQENANRQGMSIEDYAAHLLAKSSLFVKKSKKKTPITESELLQNSQLDIKKEDLKEYYHLKENFHNGTLTATDREKLSQLIDLVEMAHAKRMEYVVKLAELRRESIEKVMTDLGIQQHIL